MGAELHLPDLPDVEVSIGGRPAGRPRLPLGWWLRDLFSTYLPLLLMLLLALATAWLVRHTPAPPEAPESRPPSLAPDYTMQDFSVVRFAPDGHENLRLQGAQLRHYPATDRIEIDQVRIHAIGDDGRITDALARRALANGDVSEVELIGGAQVRSVLAGTDAIRIDSEFLHGFVRLERVQSNQPVQVRWGSNDARAGGIDYDHLNQKLELFGPVRMLIQPPPARPGARAAAAAAQ